MTEKKDIAYCESWDVSAFLVSLYKIQSVKVKYNKSLFEDSMLKISTLDGYELEFSVSSEKDRDEVFYEYLVKQVKLN